MFISGFPLVIGPGRTAGFFLQPKKARATACLAIGVFLVFVGRPMLGMVLEGERGERNRGLGVGA